MLFKLLLLELPAEVFAYPKQLCHFARHRQRFHKLEHGISLLPIFRKIDLKRMTYAPLRKPRKESSFIRMLSGVIEEVFFDLCGSNWREIEQLTARTYRLRQLIRPCGDEHDQCRSGRFFQRLQY